MDQLYDDDDQGGPVRRVFWQMMVTLEGFMEGPSGELDWHVLDDDFNRYVDEMLASIDAILLGRVTYEGFASYWPTAPESEASAMNELPKLVFSSTLQQVHWQNSRLLQGDLVSEVTKLKQQPGRDLALFGSAALGNAMLRHGLLDEIRILVAPVLLGKGRPMFQDGHARQSLRLLSSETLSSGVVHLRYVP